MNTLKLTLRKYFFDNVKLKQKTQHCLEINKHWVSVLCQKHKGCIGGDLMDKRKTTSYNIKDFKFIEFRTKNKGVVEKQILLIKNIIIGLGDPLWVAPGYPVFIIELGEHALTLQDIQEQQIQITCADEAEFTQVKNTLLNAGLTSWLFEAGRQVIQVFRDGDFYGDKQLDDNFGVVISGEEFLKRFVYE